jgi:hypothetical protein
MLLGQSRVKFKAQKWKQKVGASPSKLVRPQGQEMNSFGTILYSFRCWAKDVPNSDWVISTWDIFYRSVWRREQINPTWEIRTKQN